MTFRVIEGGGQRPPGDFDIQMAAQAFRFLTIELMRSLARGADSKRRITEQLIELYKHLGKPGVMVDTVVNSFISEASSDLMKAEMSNSEFEDDDRVIERIVLASIQVAAEKLCWDDAAQGRTSQRVRRLETCLDLRQKAIDRRSRPRR